MSSTQQMRKQPRPLEADSVDEDALYNTRMPSSARRYKPSQPIQSSETAHLAPHVQRASLDEPKTLVTPPVQRASLDEPKTQPGTLTQRRSSMSPKNSSGMASKAVAPARTPITDALPSLKRSHLVPILIGVVGTIVLFMILSSLGSWWRTYQDDLHYGRPRTSQLDAVVGHNDSAANPTHFIFINLRRHVEIIEIPGGDPARTRIFTGPILFGDGQDLTPITGEIRKINGKLDLIVHIQDQQILFVNDGTTFRPQ